MRWILLAACSFLTSGWASAQEADLQELIDEVVDPRFSEIRENEAQEAGAQENDLTPAREEKLESLRTIAEPISTALADLGNLQAEIRAAETEDAKQQIQIRIDAERERISQLRENFRDVLGGSEAAEFQDISIESKGLQEQISELVEPFLSGIREATAEPRELDALRKELEAAKERKRKADVVLARIDELIAASESEILADELKSARRIWASHLAQANSQIAVNTVQIDERTRDQRSAWEKLSTGFNNFFKSKGMNLLLAILAAVLGFIATRKLYVWIRHISPVHKKNEQNFTSRISDVLALAVAVLVSLLGVILVFYTRGDWLLLTLVIIFLIGIAWAGKTAIPPYLEQIRMILNLGSVREGERVIHAGLPWKVSKLGFFTIFTNPRLEGGMLRVPIRDVMGMISRPVAPKEVWFPTEEDDWVNLSDDTYGKTIIQTPDQVVVLRLGGSMKTYPTADFLELAPENLSHGFRISVTFGIDYMHQAECTTTIPEIFQTALLSALINDHGKDAVRSIKVEFASASASSLDYEILADFDGSLASRLNPIRRKIQTVCVDVCNENGWVIPFTQITVHQSES